MTARIAVNFFHTASSFSIVVASIFAQVARCWQVATRCVYIYTAAHRYTNTTVAAALGRYPTLHRPETYVSKSRPLVLPTPCRSLLHLVHRWPQQAAAVDTVRAASRRRRNRPLCVASGLMCASSSAQRRRADAVARMPPLAHRKVMLALAGEAEAALGSRLLPSEVPADVAEFRNASGNGLGSVDVRRGVPGSSVEFTLEAWFHRQLPGAGGGAIDISSLIFFLNGATDAPHFLMGLIQGGPTSLVILLDLFPRRDLPLHPDYIAKYYEATGVDAHRRSIERLPQVRPYVSPSLLVRSLWSPTAVVVDVQCGEGGEEALEEIVRGQLATSAKEVLGVWLQHCGAAVEMADAERASMVARDKMISTMSVELNLSANLPRMFDADVSARVVAEIGKAFLGR